MFEGLKNGKSRIVLGFILGLDIVNFCCTTEADARDGNIAHQLAEALLEVKCSL